MYESTHSKPLPLGKFLQRVLFHAGFVTLLLGLSLLGGMLGYRHFEGMGWVDAFLNTAMLLGGMGPVDTLQTNAGKVFAGIYAMYAGLLVIAAAAVLFTPFLHRLMHLLHWKDRQP